MKQLLVIGVVLFATAGTGTVPRATAADPAHWAALARPSPLDADEEGSPLLVDMARRFNPAMAFHSEDVWPVEIRYSWHDGADLVARTVGPTGRALREVVAVRHADVERKSWGELPQRDGDGNPIEYRIDAPGDERMEHGMSGWRRRWHEITATASFPPTQYAHFFWLNRERGLLGIQYWFFYPFNEWINLHEGDWEHINVVVEGPRRLTADATFRAVGYQFFFHFWSHEPSTVVRIGGSDPREDHVVVYVGGSGRLLTRSGSYSGGCYPLPGVYRGAGWSLGPWRPSDDTTNPRRFVNASEFKIIVLPEPDRLAPAAHPELSWLRLPFFAGGAKQPARRLDWNGGDRIPAWSADQLMGAQRVAVPPAWRVLESTLASTSRRDARGKGRGAELATPRDVTSIHDGQ